VVQWFGLIAAVTAAAIGSWIWIARSRATSPPPPRQATRFSIQFPPDAPIIGSVGIGSQIALSPDGRTLVYASRAVAGSNHLYVRTFDQIETRQLPGTEGAIDPFFSADGQWIGFFAGRKLLKVASSGGPLQTIAELEPSAVGFGASWSSDGTVLFARARAGLWKVPSTGGVATPVTRLREKETNHAWPHVLPGGQVVLFSAISGSESQIYAQSLATGQRRVVGAGTRAHYVTSGHVVYGAGSRLFAVPFDAERLEVVGTPVTLVENVLNKGGAEGVVQAAVSPGGSLAFVPATPSLQELMWVDRTGKYQPLNLPARPYLQPRLAPDAERLAVLIVGENASADVWSWDFSRETFSRLTDEGGHNYLLWTPDGRRWRNELYRYGVRLTYDIVVPHPGRRVLARYNRLRELEAQIAKGFQPPIGPNSITTGNWQLYANQYKVPLPAPPPDLTISDTRTLTYPANPTDRIEELHDRLGSGAGETHRAARAGGGERAQQAWVGQHHMAVGDGQEHLFMQPLGPQEAAQDTNPRTVERQEQRIRRTEDSPALTFLDTEVRAARQRDSTSLDERGDHLYSSCTSALNVSLLSRSSSGLVCLARDA
jgi:hypothetical protein